MKFHFRESRCFRNVLVCGLVIAYLLGISSNVFAQLPNPTYGWNLGNTMEPPAGVGAWGGTPTQALINSVSASGFNVIRIPCAWDSRANQTTYKIDPAYMAQVKQVVDWSYAKGLYVIVNDHWDDGWLENHITATVNPIINAKMKSYWTQIATAFAGYDNHLLFAGANEPGADNAAKTSTLVTYYQTFINAVRGAGGDNQSRWLVIQAPETNTDLANLLMSNMPTDTTPGRLMVEVHYYSPYKFTMMSSDASWGKMSYYWGQGYHSSTEPDRNSTSDDEQAIDAAFQKMYALFSSKGIPVLLGEFGVATRSNLTGSDKALNIASTTYWNKYVVDCAQCYGLYPVYWNTPGSLFDWTTGAIKDQNTIKSLTGGSALPPPGGDGAQYCFELDSQAWTPSGAPIIGVGASSAVRFAGSQSLAVGFDGPAGTAQVDVASPSIPAGRTITFHVWIPNGNQIRSIRPYAVDRNRIASGDQSMTVNLRSGSWNTLTVALPANAATPLQQVGVQFTTRAAWSGTCYIDSISW